MSEVGEHLGRSDGPELGRGLSESAVITGRMGQASQASQFKVRGRLLAVSEAHGVLAGVLCYYHFPRRTRDQ